jgi:glycosyltransferase involved in cell wall biosynthesis
MTPSPDPRQPSVLIVFPWCLDRAGHGNVQRVLAMARYLSRHDVDVDLVYQGNPRVPNREHELIGFRRVLRVDAWESYDDTRLYLAWEAFFGEHDLPSSNLCPGSALVGLVRGLLDAIDYTAVIASYAWTAPMFDGLASPALRIVDLHDVLSLHVDRCEQATGDVAPFSMSADTERFLWQHWDALLAITDQEARLVAPSLRPSQRLMTMPHGVPALDLGTPASDSLVYIGSDNHSNQAAVRWLLEDVWPRVLIARPQVTLRIVGPICEPMQRTPLRSTPRVEWAGFVDRPSDELARSTVCVAPYLYGSGLKIKVVEAAGAGRAIVTTPAGAEGSGLVHGVHALIADDAEGFAAAIVRVLDDPALRDALASAAREHVRRTMSDEACYRPLLDFLSWHTGPRPAPKLISSIVEHRLRLALAALDTPPVVVWGNGSHTRALVPVLRRLGANVRCIVDNDATIPAASVEHCAVVPRRSFAPHTGDLIVLSSQIYEPAMWRDLAEVRTAGAHVLGLYRRDLSTDTLRRRLRGETHAPDVPSTSAAR